MYLQPKQNEQMVEGFEMEHYNMNVVDETQSLQNISTASKASQKSTHCVIHLQDAVKNVVRTNKQIIKYASIAGFFACYFVYFVFAITYNFETSIPLIVITSIVLLCILYVYVRNTYGGKINQHVLIPINNWIDRWWDILKWFVYVTLILSIIYYLIFEVVTSVKQLRSIIGLVLCILLPWITCKHPSYIKWRPVLWGLGLQFVLGILVLRWRPGYNAVSWLANNINKFIFYSLAGSAGLFGDPYFIFHAFLMLVVPLVVWVGMTTTLAFHFGLIQQVASKLGWLMKITFQTTAIESISLVVNIFLSVLDTAIMLKKYIPKLTRSEFHCFLVGAHATIAGFAFGLFVLFGVNPQHLLTGAVMSAPAAVAIAKLNYPETEQSQLVNDEDFDLGTGDNANAFVAAARGALESGRSAVTILIQVIAFVSLIIFMDDVVIHMGNLVGLDISLSILVGYMFVPVSYLLGIDTEDLDTVSRMLGIKIVANEFLGFILLGKYQRDDMITDRSGAIATYAMCGFSSFGTFAIFIGVWNSVDPERTSEVSNQIPRLMMNSNLACFTTACIASLFYNEDVNYENPERTFGQEAAVWLLGVFPTYETVLSFFGFTNV